MAIRNVVQQGDPVLSTVCKPLKKVSARDKILIDDMLETMYANEGVGLAAPQVGVLKRIVVIDVGDGIGPYILVNPQIVEMDGEQTGYEGCLSLKGYSGMVTRPNHVIVRAMDENFQPVEYEGEGLLARAFCHELDHLEGKMYTQLVQGDLLTAEQLDKLLEEQEEEEGEYEDASWEEA